MRNLWYKGIFLFGFFAVILALGLPFITYGENPILVSEHGQTVGDQSDLLLQSALSASAYDWQLYGKSIASLHIPFSANTDNFTSDYFYVQNTEVTVTVSDERETGYFNGLADLRVNHNENALFESGKDMSFGGWIKPDNIAQKAYIGGKRQITTPFAQWGLSIFDGTLNYNAGKKIVCTYGIANGNFHDVATLADVVDGNWHHVVCRVRFGQGVDIFIDGVDVPTTIVRNQGWESFEISAPTTIGSGNGDSHYRGYIDDFAIYTRALSKEFIVNLADGQYGRLPDQETKINDAWRVRVLKNENIFSSNDLIVESGVTPFEPELVGTQTPVSTEEGSLFVLGHERKTHDFAIDWFNGTRSLSIVHMPFLDKEKDVSSFSHKIERSGNPLFKKEGYRSFVTLDGNSDFRAADSQSLDINADMSVEAWIRPVDKKQKAYIITKRQITTPFAQWGLSIFDGTLNYNAGKKIVCTYGIANGNFHDVATLADVVDGNWHHVVCRVRFGQGVDIFIDGVDVPTTIVRNQGWQSPVNNEPLYIGSAGTDFYYTGDIDLARVYDRALSDEQITLYADNKDYILSHKELSYDEVWSAEVIQTTKSIKITAPQDAAPFVVSYKPNKKVQWLSEGQQFNGSIECMDPEQTTVSYEWLLDGIPLNASNVVAIDYNQMQAGEHIIEARCIDATGTSTTIKYDMELLNPGDFTILMPSNVQTAADLYPNILNELTKWMVDSKEELTTEFISLSGDVVNNGGSTRQWNNLSSAFEPIDNVIPYAISIGNHDYDANLVTTNNGDRSSTYFQTYFPLSRFSSNTWWGGEQNDENINTYQFMEKNGHEFMLVHIEFCPSDASLQWANDLVSQYPQKNVIITTHLYLNYDNTTVDAKDPYNCEMFLNSSYISGMDKNNGDEIWEEFISKHDNIDLVLSGHVIGDGAGYKTDFGSSGAYVINQIFHNSYAIIPGNNDGESIFSRIYIFSPNRGKVFVRTYDPWQDKLKTDEQNKFSFDFEF